MPGRRVLQRLGPALVSCISRGAVQLQSLLEGRASGRRLLGVTLIPSATAFEFLVPPACRGPARATFSQPSRDKDQGERPMTETHVAIRQQAVKLAMAGITLSYLG